MAGAGGQVSGMEKRGPGSVYGAICLLLLLTLGAACLIILQRSLHSLPRAPRLQVDDSLPNVAVTLANHGRYGFLASPEQAPTGADRTHAFFNYGPLYYYVAAALTWLLGPSLTLYRMLHPLGLVFIVAVSVWTFRRVSLVGSAALAAAILQMYWQSAWAMARPDIMVSVCAALMFAFAARAMERGGWMNWAAMGFFAVSAATSHPIAAAVVPSAGLAWLWHTLATRREDAAGFWARTRRSLVALASGGLAGALVFLCAIQFRVRDLLSLGGGRMHQLGSSFAKNLAQHFRVAWGDLSGVEACAIAMAFGATTLLLIASSRLPMQRRKHVAAFLAAPVITAFAYSLSIGFYGDYHTGYVILCQVAVAWSAGAFLALATGWMSARTGSRRFDAAAMLAAGAIFIVMDVHWEVGVYPWDLRTAGYIDHVSYVREVTSLLPERASAGGSLYFGLEAGDRTDLVQFLDILPAAHDFRRGRTDHARPDFLVLSPYEVTDGFERDAKGRPPLIEDVRRLFPASNYRLTDLVYAPPYGTTHIYSRTSEAGGPPGVSVNDGVARQWSRALGPPLGTTFEPAAPATAYIRTSSTTPPNRALTTKKADLPAGFYLIETTLDGVGAEESGFIAATPGSYFWWPGYVGFSPSFATYWEGQGKVFLLVDHFGGPLYISRFATFYKSQHEGKFGFDVASVRRVEVLQNGPERVQALPLPDWSKWKVVNPAIQAMPDANGRVRLMGNVQPKSDLIESPPIAVPPHSALTLIVPTTTAYGAVTVSIRGNALLPTAVTMPARVVFDTGRASQVLISVSAADLKFEGGLDVSLGTASLVPGALPASGASGATDFTLETQAPLPDGASTLFDLDAHARPAPDFLVLSRHETDADFLRAAMGRDTSLESFGKTFDSVRYRPVHLVYAPSHGMARDYARVRDADDSRIAPTVAVNDGVSRQWSRHAGEPIAVQFEPAAPVHVSIAQGSSDIEVEARASLAAELPAGFFLIEAGLDKGEGSDFVAATPGRYLRWTGGVNDLALPVAPVLPYEDRVFLLVDHLGGKLYLSLFGKKGGGTPKLEAISVRPVPVLRNGGDRVAPIPAPAWSAWKTASPGVSLQPEDGGGAQLTGPAQAAGAILLRSAPFAVPAHTKLVLTLPADAESGTVRIGSTDAPGRSLFDSGAQTQAVITLVNGNSRNGTPIAIHLGRISLEPVAPKGLYVDSLMACRSFVAPKSPDCK